MLKHALRYLLCCLFVVATLNAQDKSTYRWYFGNKQGLNFNTSPPTLLNDGQSVHIEGTSVVCDAQTGDLLFYTDGNTIWDRNQTQMATGLNPSYFSSTQSALIVRQPGSTRFYHLFTTINQGGGPGRHFVIDMTLNGGLGGVASSNNALTPLNVTEKLTATRACNGVDYWIIFRRNGAGQNGFYSYRLTPAGLNTTPVNSVVGIDIVGVAPNIGEMKISPNGRFLASANHSADCELFDFNNATGVVSNARTLTLNTLHYNYGLTFSASSRFLYVNSGWSGPRDSVVRFDLTAGSIQGSLQVIGRGASALGFMELAPDGKIYIARYNTKYLATVSNPDDPSPVFVDSAFALPANTFWGLPNFPQDLFIPNYAGNDTLVCPNQPVRIGTSPVAGLSYQWTPPGGLDNPNVAQPTATVSTTTSYTLTVTDANACQIVRSMTVNTRPRPTIVMSSTAPNNAICPDASTTITAALAGAQSFSWQPGNLSGATQTVSPSASQTYIVTIVDANGCTWTDSIRITIRNRPALTISSNPPAGSNGVVSICKGSSATLTGVSPGVASYTWNTGETTPSIIVRIEGIYQVIVKDANGCTKDTSITVRVLPLPPANAGNDTSVCVNSALQLQASGGINYAWTALTNAPALSASNISNPLFTSPTTGSFSYSIMVTDTNGCVNYDTIAVTVNPLPLVQITPTTSDTSICPCAQLVLTATNAIAYQWFKNAQPISGQNGQFFTASDTGAYTVRITDQHGCSNTSSALNLSFIPVQAVVRAKVLDSAAAGEDVKLGLSGQGTNFGVCRVDSATVYMSMNMAPMAPASSELFGSQGIDGRRQLAIRISGASGTFARELRYIGTLGSTDTTIVRIDSVSWDKCRIPTTTIPDTFHLAGICTARGVKRLFNSMNVLYLSVQPNPVHSVATLHVNANAAVDVCTVRLMDILGREVRRVYEGAIREGDQDIGIPIDELLDGHYVLVVSALDGVSTLSMEVRK